MGGPPPLPGGASAVAGAADIIKAFVDNVLLSPPIRNWIADQIARSMPQAIAWGNESRIQTKADVLARMAQIQVDVENRASLPLQRLLATACSDFFGVDVSPAALPTSGRRGGLDNTADGLANTVLRALFGELGGGSGITPEQGEANAKRVLGWVIGNALEGWIQGTVGLGFLTQDLPDVAKLDDLLERALGMGRLSRRVLHPYLDALVVTPLTRKVNRTFLPEIPSAGQLVTALGRGRIQEEPFFQAMAEHGFSREWAAALRVEHKAKVGRDAVGLAYRQGWLGLDDARRLLKEEGLEDADVLFILETWKQDRLRTYLGQLVPLAIDMFADREIEASELGTLLDMAGLSPEERDAASTLATFKRGRPKHASKADMERAFALDIITEGELRAFYEQEGYAPPTVDMLVALAAHDALVQDKKDAAEASKLPPAPVDAVREATAQEAYRRNIIDADAFRAALGRLGVQGERLEAELAVWTARRADYLAAVAKKQAPPRGVHVSAGSVDTAYVHGLVDETTLRAFYGQKGYPAADVELLLLLRNQERADWLARRAAQQDRQQAATSTSRP